jgi:hypothetical protein
MAFSLSSRNRSRRADEAQKLLGQGEVVRAYAQGVAGPDPTQTIIKIIGGAIATAVLMYLLLKTFIVPGYLLFIFIYWAFNPPRALAVTDSHLVLFKRSKFNAKPVEVIGTFDRTALVAPSTERYTRLTLGNETVWASQGEYAALTQG